MEEWRPVAEFPGLYEVSSIGRVRSRGKVVQRKKGPWRFKPRMIRPHLSKKGKYLSVSLCPGDGKVVVRKVHRLVCMAFHGPAPSPTHEVNHKDFNKLNCSKENLEWMTPRENAAHRWAVGRSPRAGA